MEGQIGVLYQDKQVGGFYNWDTHVVAEFTTVDGWKEYKPVKHITARSYWLIDVPVDNQFTAEFYQLLGKQLVLMDVGEVVIDLPDTTTLDRTLYAPLEIVWMTRK